MSIRRLAFAAPAFLVAGLIVVVVFRPAASELDAGAEPVFAAVVAHEETFQRNGRVVVEVSEPETLVSSGAEGRITALDVEPGGTLTSGARVASVGGIAIVAVHTGQPFYRGLASGARGSDVAQLQCFLADQGLYDGPCDGLLGSATAAGVVHFNEMIGRGRLADFDPRFVVWLPEEEFEVGTVFLEVGSWFPAAGATILESSASIVSARIDIEPMSPTEVETFGPFVFVTTDPVHEVPVAADRTVDVADLGALARPLLAAGAGQAEPGIESDEQAPSGTAGTVIGTVVAQGLSVPTAALVETTDGLCVYVAATTGYRAVPVTVVGSSVSGATFLDGALTVDDQVVVNPHQLAMTTC